MPVYENHTNAPIRSVGYEFNRPLASSDLNESQTILSDNVIQYLNGVKVANKLQIALTDTTITSSSVTVNSLRYCAVDSNGVAFFGSIAPSVALDLPTASTDSDIYGYFRVVTLTPSSTVYLNGIRANASQASITETTTTNNVLAYGMEDEGEVSNRKSVEFTFVVVAQGGTAPTLSDWSTGTKIAELTFTGGVGKVKDVDPPAAGGSEVDDAFSLVSENPVQNKVVAAAVTQGRLSKVNITRLEFTNVSVATTDWATSGDYVRAALTLTGVTASMTPTVLYSVEDATGGVLLPTAESYAGGVYIYALDTPEDAITIPLIQCDLVES